MAEKVLHPDEREFDQLIQGDQLVLVDFWATWCAPCRMVAPIIEQVADQYAGRVAVAKVDVDEHNALAARYGVQSIPTVILFRKGEILARDVGAKPLSNYTGILDSHLDK
jgi:thioredoxin 1